MSRIVVRVSAILVMAAAGFLATSLSFEWVPAPARLSTHALAAGAATGDVIETEPIEAAASLAGLSWEGVAPEAAWVRASADGDEWGEWVLLGLDPDHGPDPGTEESATERPASDPVFLGEASHVQYRIKPANAADTLEPQTVERFTAELVDTSARGLGLEQQTVRFLKSIRIGAREAADGSPNRPNIVPRESWGGDECLTGTEPTPGRVHRVDAMFVHHAGNNDYAAGESARDLIYAHCVYHVHTRGWWDVAYNFYVDRYGVIYEGRRGGVDQPVQGGHTRGFSSYSTGVAMLGNHQEGPVTQAAQNALVDLATWKLDLSNTDPTGTVQLMSLGSSRYGEGTVVTLNRMSGHRDASSTDCPGDYCYNLLPGFRTRTEAGGGLKIYADFQDFDPQDGSRSAYPARPVRLEFTETTSWAMQIAEQGGSVVFEASGSGRSAEVLWDGTANGSLVSYGTYEVTVRAGSATPVQQTFEIREGRLDRWWGRDRYETAAAISQNTHAGGADNVFVATGMNFPDALATTPLAEELNGPVLLVRTTSVPSATLEEVRRLGAKQIYVLGGPAAVSDGVVVELSAIAPVTRIWGRDRYATATEISKAAFPDGADIAYVATGTNFPDALAGSPVAAVQGGPLLLTRGTSLTSATRSELARLAPKRIVVLGAGTVISQTVIAELRDLAPDVLGVGEQSRYTTAVAISEHGYPGGSTVAFVATGAKYPDALAAGPSAALARGPVLLTPSTFLPPSVAAELTRLDPDRVVILGGPAAVATGVEAAIEALLE